jgi:Tol biopolymer transport system component
VYRFPGKRVCPRTLRLSPDGRTLAFIRYSRGGATDSIWVIGTDGTGARQVKAGIREPVGLSWRPGSGVSG